MIEHISAVGKPFTRELAKNCVGPGWSKLIDKIFNVADSGGRPMTIHQVKEKFGGLRFYFSAPSVVFDKIYDASMLAETESFKICEQCGETGQLQTSSTGWIYTACEKCK
jgi:Mor family transcriptional regulator